MNLRLDLARAVGLGAIIGVAGWGLLDVGGLRARPVFCLGIAIAGTCLIALIRFLAADSAPVTMQLSRETDSGEQRPYTDLYFLEYRLSWGSVERDRYEQRVRPLLTRVADERLRQRHGIDRASDPEAARAIVGESLWSLMTGPPEPAAKPPNHSQMTELVTRIEEI